MSVEKQEGPIFSQYKKKKKQAKPLWLDLAINHSDWVILVID